MTRRVAVIGAGAAGLMAAIHAASAGADTTVFERTPDGGRKILISGGGRCNILPAREDPARFVTDSSPNTLRNIIRSWPLREQIAFFRDAVGIPLYEDAGSSKLFPVSQRARDVRDGLLALARRCGARVLFGARVTDVRRDGASWRIAIASAASAYADAVVLATGGSSVPATGSDGFSFTIATRLGLDMIRPYPALTPLLCDDPPFASLAGVSLRAGIAAEGAGRAAESRGGFLFTHRGYSGPAVLDVSHVAVRSLDGGDPPAGIVARWTAHDEQEWDARLRSRTGTVQGALRGEVPERLADALLSRARIDASRSLSRLRRDERRAVITMLVRFPLPWTGHAGYHDAEVTGGGVRLSEIDPRTLECRGQPGLHLCGELLDAFGPIGGYNFLWAWATGRAAGRGAAQSVSG